MLARLGIVVIAVAACGRAADDDDASTQAHDSSDADSGSVPDPGCSAETRDDDYMLGLERTGERVTVRFVDAIPAPPARFDNLWTIEVLDFETQTPLENLALDVEPFMPDHNHGTSIACDVTEMDAPGQLQLDPVNLFMPGLWEVRLHFTLDDDATDQVVFRFCVDP